MTYTEYRDNAKSYLEKMLAILDIEATVVEEEIDDITRCYRIECKPDDARILIGRNGQTLESLQFVVRQMCRSSASEQGPFVVDILDYRSRRKRSIEEQAKHAAVAVLNGESDHFALLPMNAYERRIVHQYLHDDFPELVSESEGEGIDRHIVISFKGIPASSKRNFGEDGVSAEGEDYQEEDSFNEDLEESERLKKIGSRDESGSSEATS